jgi:Tfp pilus assembly protein PilE
MKRSLALIEIMIAIAIVALLAAITIPRLLSARIIANESTAQATLKIISTALETYAAANNGLYAPSNDINSDNYLRKQTPPYLNKAYCAQTESGYAYSCSIDKNDYTITARPLNCSTAGTKSFTITAGGLLTIDTSCTPAGS